VVGKVVDASLNLSPELTPLRKHTACADKDLGLD
jgi:hypothetical protein